MMTIRPFVIAAAFDHVEHASALAICAQVIWPTIVTTPVLVGCVVVLLVIHVAFVRRGV